MSAEMTLRDYFAAHLVSMCLRALRSGERPHSSKIQNVAANAYAMADAMLDAREEDTSFSEGQR
jgi:hypothetical protein